MVMFVPFGVIYCYYQKHFRVYKAVGMSCLTTFFIESTQFILKTGVVDIDDFICKHIGKFDGNYGVCYSATDILQKSKV